MPDDPRLRGWVDAEAFALDTNLDADNRWVTSPANEISVPRDSKDSARHIIVRDDTLRSGSNTPGVFASHDKKLRIADALEEMGVQEAEVGYGSLPDDREFVEKLRKRGNKMMLGMHARSWLPQWKSDVDGIADCGGQLINFVGMQGYTLSSALHPQLRGEAFLERMEECIAYAKSKGLVVAFGTDHPRPELVAPTVRRAVAAGADRWVVYDARGWFVPQTMALLVSLARSAGEGKIDVTVHAHDDFGLATINTFEGIRAGAIGCDTCINRTGHRCGNAAFEQVVVGLPYFYGYETGIDLSKVTGISKMVSDLYEVPVSENTPVVGHNMFSYGGLHINGILRGDWFLWENLKAETVGSGRHIVYGPTALQGGTDSPLEAKVVVSAGKSPSEAQLERVMSGVRELIQEKKFATDEEVERIISRVMG